MSFLPALFIVFLAMKLTGFIDWSWLLVTAPLWALPLLGVLYLAAGLVLFMLAGGTVDEYSEEVRAEFEKQRKADK